MPTADAPRGAPPPGTDPSSGPVQRAARTPTTRGHPHAVGGRGPALAKALGVAIAAAAGWALLKGILEFPGVLALAVVAGWAVGALLWQGGWGPLVAVAIAAVAWGVGLVLTWMLAMLILPGSSRTWFERLQNTPFLEWQAPQLGFLELASLVLYVLAAAYGARRRT
jgi:hypothetical protein